MIISMYIIYNLYLKVKSNGLTRIWHGLFALLVFSAKWYNGHLHFSIINHFEELFPKLVLKLKMPLRIYCMYALVHIDYTCGLQIVFAYTLVCKQGKSGSDISLGLQTISAILMNKCMLYILHLHINRMLHVHNRLAMNTYKPFCLRYRPTISLYQWQPHAADRLFCTQQGNCSA